MKRRSKNDDLRSEYSFDYSKAVRGKYYRRLITGSNVVLLEPDVAKAFPDSAAVNKALRTLLKRSNSPQRRAVASGKAKKATAG